MVECHCLLHLVVVDEKLHGRRHRRQQVVLEEALHLPTNRFEVVVTKLYQLPITFYREVCIYNKTIRERIGEDERVRCLQIVNRR